MRDLGHIAGHKRCSLAYATTNFVDGHVMALGFVCPDEFQMHRSIAIIPSDGNRF